MQREQHLFAVRLQSAVRAALRSRFCAVVAACIGVAGAPCVAQEDEFAPFRVTEVEGTVSARLLRDEATTRIGAAGTSTTSTQSDLRSTALVFLSTRSFVYHPNLLALDIGFGPIYQRGRFVTEAGSVRTETDAGKGLYDLSARATFLRGKPYTGALFYEHLNPYVSVGPALVILQENTRRGAEFSLFDPATPVPMTVEANRSRSLGRGGTLVVDDQIDRYSLTADRALGLMGSTRLRVDGTRQDSQSGSVDLPIVRTTSHSTTAGLDTRLQLGPDGRHRVANLITYSSLRYDLGLNPPADRRDMRGLLDLRTRHSDALQSFANVNVANADQGAVRSQTRNGVAGATWWPVQDLATTMEVRGESIRTTEFKSSLRGAAASADYQWPLAGGRAQAGYAVRYDDRAQTALAPSTPVIGERHVLAGVTIVPLDQPRVVAGSVRVWNEARTQAYVEGRDYLLSVVGIETRIQRIVTGDILDGQTVLVDYAVETGGTFEYTQLDRTVNLFWSWRNRFSAYARRFDSSPHLTAGVPLLTLNEVRSTIVGARCELPMATMWSVGASVEHENRRETIQPFKRNAADVFVLWEEALLGQGAIRLGARRVRVDYESSLQDVDLTGYDLRYWVYAPWGIELHADWSTEKDTGGPVGRRRDFGSLRARWRYRQLLMSLSGTRTREAQDSLQTTRTLMQFLLQRNF